MKVALCFSGQPRFVNECSDLIINNAIQNYDVDIFGHLWFDDDLKNKPNMVVMGVGKNKEYLIMQLMILKSCIIQKIY